MTGIALGRAIIDPHIATYSPAQRLQRVLERRPARCRFRIIVCEDLQYADAPHLVGLLCMCRMWPRDCHTAEQGYELPPPHPGVQDGGQSPLDAVLPGSGHGAALSATILHRIGSKQTASQPGALKVPVGAL